MLREHTRSHENGKVPGLLSSPPLTFALTLQMYETAPLPTGCVLYRSLQGRRIVPPPPLCALSSLGCRVTLYTKVRTTYARIAGTSLPDITSCLKVLYLVPLHHSGVSMPVRSLQFSRLFAPGKFSSPKIPRSIIPATHPPCYTFCWSLGLGVACSVFVWSLHVSKKNKTDIPTIAAAAR